LYKQNVTSFDFDMMSSHPNNRKSIIYRSIVKDDLEQIEQLHEVLFPIRYQKSFYQQLLNPTTITVLAVISQQFYRSDQQGGQQIVGVSTLREVHETLGRRFRNVSLNEVLDAFERIIDEKSISDDIWYCTSLASTRSRNTVVAGHYYGSSNYG